MIDDLGVPQDGQPGHGDHGRLHVHYDAACPSIIVPAPVSLASIESWPLRSTRQRRRHCGVHPPAGCSGRRSSSHSSDIRALAHHGASCLPSAGLT
jgi:hypothetical protein